MNRFDLQRLSDAMFTIIHYESEIFDIAFGLDFVIGDFINAAKEIQKELEWLESQKK